jgi:hypothetical protein
MNTIVRCPRTGRACSREPVVNGIGVGRCSSAACHPGAAFEAHISTEMLRQNPSRSSVHHEGGPRKAALPVPRRDVYRAENGGWSRPDSRTTATALVRECQDLSVSE